MSAQLLHDPYSIDWREVIAGKDGVWRNDDRPRKGGHRELGLGRAIVIAAGIEILAGAVVALMLASPHPQQHKRSHNTPMRVHLVSASAHAVRHSAHRVRKMNPAAGRSGARRQSAKAHVSGGSAGVALAASANSGLRIAPAFTPDKRKGSGHITLNAACASAQAGCLNERELRRYLQHLHGVLQQRLAGLIRHDIPIGAGPVVLRFVGKPRGGEPGQVAVIEASAGSDAGRQLRLALQSASLPPFPQGLGNRRLTFKVALRAGGG